MPELLLTGFWIFFSALFGLLIGSFLNVCIYRLPAGITIVRGHSFCPNCRHPLGPADLVPVLSYLMLGRKCRYCKKPISSRYARVELLTGAYFGLAAWLWRPGGGTPVASGWLAGLMSGRNFPPDSFLADSARLLAGIGLAGCAMLAFSGFLVWAMIFFDRHKAPWGLFLFTAVPVFLRLALQPGRIPGHLAALALSWLLLLLLRLFKLLPEPDRASLLSLGAGFGLLGLMAGLQAIQPVLAMLLIELALTAYFQNRRSSGTADIDSRARQVWQSLPLQCVLIAAVLWLVF